MKKHILLCLLCSCLPIVSYTQIYLKGYTGYALATGSEKWSPSVIESDRNYAFSYPLKFGQGVNLGLSIGYTLNKNIAFEITGNTQLFSKFSYSPYEWKLEEYHWSQFFYDLEYTTTMFQLSPQIVFKSNPYKQWIFYLKGGPDFIRATYKKTTQTTPFDVPPFMYRIPSYLYTTEDSGNINTGIQCSFGTEYKLSKNICIYAELTTVDVRYTFNRSQILRYEIDGVDALSTLESTEPDRLDYRVRFNYAGLNIGVKYNFR